jgi:hypothetical protein
MHPKNQNPSSSRRRKQGGQALVESSLTLLLFLMTLIAALDFSQLLFTHQMLVERVRVGLRWGMINSWDGTGDGIANVVMYNQPTAKTGGAYLGLTRANVQVAYSPATAANPNDVQVKVSIVNYRYQFLTPFIAHSFTNNGAVVETTPVTYR